MLFMYVLLYVCLWKEKYLHQSAVMCNTSIKLLSSGIDDHIYPPGPAKHGVVGIVRR